MITGTIEAPEFKPIQWRDIILQVIADKNEYFKEIIGVDVSQILIIGTSPNNANIPQPGGYDNPIKIPDAKESWPLDIFIWGFIKNSMYLYSAAGI